MRQTSTNVVTDSALVLTDAARIVSSSSIASNGNMLTALASSLEAANSLTLAGTSLQLVRTEVGSYTLRDAPVSGNARELGNVLQRALVLRDGERIEADDLHVAGAPQPLRIVSATPVAAVAAAPVEPIRLRDVAHHSKLEAIRTALRETDGHRAAAARKLGISERTLRYRLASMRGAGMLAAGGAA